MTLTFPDREPLRLTPERKTAPPWLGVTVGLVFLALACAAFAYRGLFEGFVWAWPALLIGGLCGLVGLIALQGAYYNVRRGRTPNLQIDLSANPIARGTPATITITQPGPADWRSLRVTVQCFEQTFKWGEHAHADDDRLGDNSFVSTDEKLVSELILFDVSNTHVARGQNWQRQCHVDLPQSARASFRERDNGVEWRVKIDGVTASGLRVPEVYGFSVS